jgi:hypothetical protein
MAWRIAWIKLPLEVSTSAAKVRIRKTERVIRG